MSEKLLSNFQEIVIESTEDKIIRQIRSLITSGQLNPGDRLPSERKLAEKLGVGRSYVRDAIRKLEVYGILKTLPQSGTVVAGIGIAALEGLISNVLRLEDLDFTSLVETRVILEAETARYAAERRTEANIKELQEALQAYEVKVRNDEQAVEEDLLFHLAVADASQNTVLKSIMLIITPDLIHNFLKLDVCKDGRFYRALDEHKIIVQHIIEQNPDEAAKAMKAHLDDVLEYSQLMKDRIDSNGVNLQG